MNGILLMWWDTLLAGYVHWPQASSWMIPNPERNNLIGIFCWILNRVPNVIHFSTQAKNGIKKALRINLKCLI